MDIKNKVIPGDSLRTEPRIDASGKLWSTAYATEGTKGIIKYNIEENVTIQMLSCITD